MSLELFLFWGIIGWCGTPWPRRWPPSPPPPPSPWWFASRIVGLAGGVIGGYLFNDTWPVQDQGTAGLVVAASSIGALAGSIFLQDILGRVAVSPQPSPPP